VCASNSFSFSVVCTWKARIMQSSLPEVGGVT
jgi:hypothetical protein